MERIAKYITDNYFNETPYIVTEFAEHSIESYLKQADFPEKLSK
jgi:serine/threonine protein kinase